VRNKVKTARTTSATSTATITENNHKPQPSIERNIMLGTVLLVLLILMLLGAWPTWPHSRSWGYYPSGGLGVLLVILIILLLLGRI
jgi:hypothetical protein